MHEIELVELARSALEDLPAGLQNEVLVATTGSHMIEWGEASNETLSAVHLAAQAAYNGHMASLTA